MKIAFFELESWEKDEIRRRLGHHELIFVQGTLNKDNLESITDVDILSTFVFSRITREVIEKLPNLKMIATMSTGFDHIDLQACKERGIVVMNVPRYGENTVAEHTFALMLALSRKLYQSVVRTHRKHSFETDETLRGFDLKGKTLGVIGCGGIGKQVVRIASAFGMQVLIYDPHLGSIDTPATNIVDIDTLLAGSDIITLHIPSMPATHHFIDAEKISKMKDGAYIINTSRGALIDTPALVNALKTGKIAGAGLDVLEEENCIKEEKELLSAQIKNTCDLKTLLENHVLMTMENVIITPHNAFNSREALMRIIETTIENIEKYAESGELKNIVTVMQS